MTPIPKDAKLVYKGILFKVYQWQQKMFDGSYRTFEAVKRNDNAQVLTTIANKVILIKENQPGFNRPYISLPGGNVDENEIPAQAASRELLEETGIECTNLQLLATDKAGSKLHRTFYLYLGKNAKKIKQPQQTAGERVELLELEFEDFVKETQKKDFRNPLLRNIIKDLLHNPEQLKEFKNKLFAK